MTAFGTAHTNRFWADLLIEELLRAGAGLFCLAPGSRSTPLVAAVAENPRAEHIMHFDERGTAFYALGFARATRRPAVWITTSGTAVANGFPAVVEASVDGVPMVLLTADRPPELRDTGANQTIDQVKLFGSYVRWSVDLPPPDAGVNPAMVLTTVDQAVYRSRRIPAGPVHINAMFREPLAPEPDRAEAVPQQEFIRAYRDEARPYSRYAASTITPQLEELRALWAELKGVRHGLVVAGRLDTPAQADSVRWLADRLGWPLLPDIGSHLRLGGASPGAVHFYDLLLASERFCSEHQPEAVIVFGSRPTSKRLGQFLARCRPSINIVVRENPSRFDPYHQVTHVYESDVVGFCAQLLVNAAGETEAEAGWMTDWAMASDRTGAIIEEALGGDLSEPQVARTISSEIPEASGLFLASSMPVRDADTFAAVHGKLPFVAANRGASGIDGTVATAAGFAHGLGSTTTLIIGDLALLHDLNSLSLVAQAPHAVIIVVINNNGGGIFHFLPIARHEDVFETFFGTPHGYTFEHAARMFGIGYDRATTVRELEHLYRKALDRGMPHLLEVKTDRESNVALHRRIEGVVAEALG